ncbi:rhodanese-like domain-containing protein [Saccharopolyspora erythraea]|uniref:Rhodanese-like protein n=2 Tax=Saccharopolyspora erythraea TaxID=1836 RepID=A4FCF3_SACEN|nr:rhodanese-like domain-containing protein [Saccharopolyspora erythraea]EQD83894.1 sulfurtransferase [Saccharopolyspora erythraea D]QRK93491.1 rhodanese-like domain-containing protein [Saccharopolyspora erythraea]CAM01728.1 rhodanese-like protein [Saccharopolyspora erythraea NRRL 2338]
MDTAQVRELRETEPQVRLIDVRTPGEFASAHIPGSSNVPLDLIQKNRHELGAVRHGDPVVLVCASGNRAERARALLEEAGLERLSVLRGGITGWERDGGDLSRGRGTWAMERQVRLTAGVLVLTGVVASTAYEPLKWIAGFVGAGLIFAAVTNTCAMARLLGLLPHNRTTTTDTSSPLEEISGKAPGARTAG